MLAFAAGFVQVSPADVDQGERAGQWINGPDLWPQANQALGPVGDSSAAEGGFDLGRLRDGDGGGVPDHQGGERVAGGDARQVAAGQGVGVAVEKGCDVML